MKLRLIENWRSAWRWASVQLAALLAIASAAYVYLPAMQLYLPETWVTWAALAIIVARVIQQGGSKAQP